MSTANEKPKVLVIDDHEDYVYFVRLALTNLGCQVMTSTSAQDALNTLSDVRPGLILLDMRMPGINGVEFIRALRNSPYRDIPVIVVTAQDTPESRKICFEAGCDDYLAKPFRFSDLQSRITQILSRRRPKPAGRNKNNE